MPALPLHNSFQPLVSIVLPAYNAEGLVETAIHSVLAQTYPNFEFLIADDASTDGTRRAIDKFDDPRIRPIHNSENLGYLRTFNKLLEHARGDFITFVDADDWISPTKIEQQLAEFQKRPELGLCGTNYAAVAEAGRIVRHTSYPLTGEDIADTYRSTGQLCVCGSSVMVRRAVVEEIGGYREYFDRCPGEDYDWILRIMEKYDCANIADISYFYRFRRGSLTRQVKKDIKTRHIMDIIRFLAEQRQQNGQDSLSSGDMRPLEAFVASLAEPYRADPAKLNRQLSIEYAINKEWTNSLKHLRAAFADRPLQLRNYKAAVLALAALSLPTEILFWLKERLGYHHVAERL